MSPQSGERESAPKLHPDLALVRRALWGEVEAVDALISKMGCVYRLLAQRNARLGGPFGQSDLEDLAQDVTIAVWKKLDRYEGRASLTVWVARFVHLETIYRLRRTDGRPKLLGDVGPLLEAGLEDRAGPRPDGAEDLQPALERLDPDQAEVIRLKHFEGLTFTEIADRLGAGQNTAKTRYYRGLRRMREILLGKRARIGEGAS